MNWILTKLLGLKASQLEGVDSVIPTFSAEYGNWAILAMIVIFGGLVALTVYSYLREGDHRRRVKLTIAAIRIVVIVLIFAMLLQPAVILRSRENFYSTVVVLIDDSLSMSLSDRYADAARRADVAKRLGVTDGELAELPRTEIVRRIMARQGGPLARLGRDHRLAVFRFAAGEKAYTEPIAEMDVSEAPDADVRTATAIMTELRQKLVSGGFQTNLAAALRDAVDKLPGRKLAGIVMISDGQVTGGGEAADRLRAAVAYVRQRGVPVYSVGVGDPEPPQNVTIVRFQAPGEARKGSDVELTVYLANRNCGGQTTEVKLLRRPAGEGQFDDTGVSEKVELVGAPDGKVSETQEVLLRHEVKELGEFEYKVLVTPLEKEFTGADNEATARLRVTDEKLKILLVSGDAGWEFQYLRNYLLRSPDRFALSVWQQDAEKEFNQEASSGMRLTQLPRTREELFEYEVVILYDPAYTVDGFDKVFVEMLDDFIANHHGGLCFIAGNKYSDMNLAGGAAVKAESDPFKSLAELMPVVLDRETINFAERITQGQPAAWPVLPTAVGLDHPMLRLGRDTKDTERLWGLLPGTYWLHPVQSLKPLATALAVSSDPVRRMTKSGDPCPLIAVQYYGKGRTVFIGFDETWRWRALEDGVFYRRFWSATVDFLASGRLQKKRFIITTGADRFAVNEEMRIKVEAYAPDFRALEDKTVRVQMLDAASGEKVGEPIALNLASEKVPGHYEAAVRLSKVGRFELTMVDAERAEKDLIAGKTIVVEVPQEEFVHPEADPNTLRTVAGVEHVEAVEPAEKSRYMDIQHADRLPELIGGGKMSLTNDVRQDLWDIPLALAVIVALLAVEWILRKKYNMA